MNQYRHIFRCKHCGTKWSKVSSKATMKQPRCINLDCDKPHRDIGFDPAGTAPAIGGSTIVRAVDYTAEVVMQDHKLTDLKDNIRVGETMAPKLPMPMQQAADTFFDPKNNPQIAANPRRQAYLQNLGKRAIAGAFRSTALDVKGVLPDNRVKLRQAGTERIRQQ